MNRVRSNLFISLSGESTKMYLRMSEHIPVLRSAPDIEFIAPKRRANIAQMSSKGVVSK